MSTPRRCWRAGARVTPGAGRSLPELLSEAVRPVATLALCALLAACGGDDSEGRVVHQQDFSEGSGGWSTALTLLQPEQVPAEKQSCWTSWLGLQACTVDAPIEGERMVLQSPWWLDPNHAPPGAGYLSLLTWVYLDGPPGSSTHGVGAIDLRDATLRIAIRAQDLDLKGSHLHFWFQTAMPDGRFANFVYTRAPIDALFVPGGNALELIELDLSSDPQAWTCLGAASDRVDTYGCTNIGDALHAVNNDFGFILFPVSGSPLPEHQPSGRFEIQSIELVNH